MERAKGKVMRLGFCLFKYFPYGGLQRDFFDIAQQCRAMGHDIFVYTLAWQGKQPTEFNIRLIESRAIFNHKKYEKYHARMLKLSEEDQLDCLVGFNKMPGLDVYFASDPSYKAKGHGLLQRLGGRYRHFVRYEAAVFDPSSRTRILTIALAQQQEYQRVWKTDDDRFSLLPPGITRLAMADDRSATRRAHIRAEFGLAEQDLLLLMIGSGFRTKGLDRVLRALKSLPEELLEKSQLVVIGQDKPDTFNKMAARMGLSDHVQILPGRSDIKDVMQAGDCLVHPAYREVAGKVILEAVVGGLPVLVSDVCGYAGHVALADAGFVLQSPFNQQVFDRRLSGVLADEELRKRWRENGIAYGKAENLYQMTGTAAQAIQNHCSEKVGGIHS